MKSGFAEKQFFKLRKTVFFRTCLDCFTIHTKSICGKAWGHETWVSPTTWRKLRLCRKTFFQAPFFFHTCHETLRGALVKLRARCDCERQAKGSQENDILADPFRCPKNTPPGVNLRLSSTKSDTLAIKLQEPGLQSILPSDSLSFASGSISPPARWGLLDFIRAVVLLLLLLLRLLQFLLDHVCINFHVHFRLANSSPIPSPTSTLPTLRQALRQSLRQLPRAVGTAGPQLPASDLSGHGWTSTARFRAQWAPLDLNHKPSEPSGQRWTSTWELPSSVGTAGPQRPDRMSEDMPGRMPEDMPDRMPDRMPEDMSDRMPEDLPVTKRMNVMVGMTRSKVIFSHWSYETQTSPALQKTQFSGSIFCSYVSCQICQLHLVTSL